MRYTYIFIIYEIYIRYNIYLLYMRKLIRLTNSKWFFMLTFLWSHSRGCCGVAKIKIMSILKAVEVLHGRLVNSFQPSSS